MFCSVFGYDFVYVYPLTIVECVSLTAPDNGYVDMSNGNDVNATAYYSCGIGYTLDGNAITTCLPSGQWNSSVPGCVPVDCGDLFAPNNGYVNKDTGTSYGQLAVYSCHTGYEITGIVSRECLDTGYWSESTPECNRVGTFTLIN